MAINTRLLADDLDLLVNLPAINQGNDVIARFNELTNLINDGRRASDEAMNEHFRVFNERLDTMARRQTAESESLSENVTVRN